MMIINADISVSTCLQLLVTNDRNVIIDGTWQRHESEDSIDFKMALSAGEVVISMKNLDLTDRVRSY
jgi:hypothetical protein